MANKVYGHCARFNLYEQNLDSENYQLMNYGIGGTISGHVDSSGRGHKHLNKYLKCLSSQPTCRNWKFSSPF